MDAAELADLLARHGVVRLRDHTHPYRAARRLESAGRVDRVLPGLLVPADADLIVLGAALTAHDPDAVLIEEAAAALTFRRSTRRPSLPLLYASPRKLRAATPWFRAVRRRIDPDDITQVGPVRVTGPALTALDLATRDDAAAIDDAVRTGAATLDDLHAAMDRTRARRGNAVRRLLLAESIGRPWSTGERRLHRILREAGIDGWRGNRPVLLEDGRWVFLDVGFDDARVDLEVDGWRHHHTPGDLAHDAERQNALVLAGWLPFRVTAAMLDDPDRLVADLRTVLELRSPGGGGLSAAASAARRRAG